MYKFLSKTLQKSKKQNQIALKFTYSFRQWQLKKNEACEAGVTFCKSQSHTPYMNMSINRTWSV